MTELYHPSTLTDDYGNKWFKREDGDYNSDIRTGWSLDEICRVYGVSADQIPPAEDFHHEHEWIDIRALAEPGYRQMCNGCGQHRFVHQDGRILDRAP